MNHEITEIFSSNIYGALEISSNTSGFAFVGDKKHDIIIEPIDLVGLKLSNYNNEFVVGSEKNTVHKSYLAKDKSEPTNSFIYLELTPVPADSGICNYRAYIVSKPPELKTLKKLYTNCDI